MRSFKSTVQVSVTSWLYLHCFCALYRHTTHSGRAGATPAELGASAAHSLWETGREGSPGPAWPPPGSCVASTRVLCFHSVIIQLGDKRRSAFLNRMRSHQHSVNWSPPRLAAEHVQKSYWLREDFRAPFQIYFRKNLFLLRICFSTHTNGTSQGGSILYREGRTCHIETGAPQYTENSETGRSMSQRQLWPAPELYETGCWPMRIDTLDDIKTRLPLRST